MKFLMELDIFSKAFQQYEWQFQWSHPIGNAVIAHHDGAVSVMVAWSGLDCELHTLEEKTDRFRHIYQVMEQYNAQYYYEHHLWRELDDSLLHSYIDTCNQFTRAKAWGIWARQELARHLSQYSMSNQVATVITLPMTKHPVRRRNLLKLQIEMAKRLIGHATVIANLLPQGKIVSVNRYASRIVQTLDRPSFLRNPNVVLNENYLINEQLVRERPKLDMDRMNLRVGKVLAKVFVIWLPPDADHGDFLSAVSKITCPMHITQIVKPVDRKKTVESAEKSVDTDAGMMGKRGRTSQSNKISQQELFAEHVESNNLPVFRNIMVVTLYGTEEQIAYYSDEIVDFFTGPGSIGSIKDAPYLQDNYFIVSQPGMGYTSKVMRPPDHLWQVANSAPVQVRDIGARLADGTPDTESVRLTSASETATFSFRRKALASMVSIAISRGGKDMQAGHRITELNPLGVDFAIFEMHPSHKWTTEALGGPYYTIDENTSINPFPPYTVATNSLTKMLDEELASGTVQALAFVLTERMELTLFEEVVAKMALQYLYVHRHPKKLGPNLVDFKAAIKNLLDDGEFEGDEIEAAKTMVGTVSSLLKLPIGKAMCVAENIDFETSIIGFDFSHIAAVSKKTMTYYIILLSVRLFYSGMHKSNHKYLVLNDMSIFLEEYPEVLGKLIRLIAFMGAKKSFFVWLISQETSSLDYVDEGILKQIANIDFLFRQKDHDEFAERFQIPEGVLNTWKAFENPVEKDYRPMISKQADSYHDLHLTFPLSLRLHYGSSPDELELKSIIEKTITDPWLRIKALKSAIDERKRLREKQINQFAKSAILKRDNEHIDEVNHA